MCRPMDEDDQARLELCKALCTHAGMLFEDLSPRAIVVSALSGHELAALIRDLRCGTDRASTLLAAADFLTRN